MILWPVSLRAISAEFRCEEVRVTDLVSTAVEGECKRCAKHRLNIDLKRNVVDFVFRLLPATLREAVIIRNVLNHVDYQEEVEGIAG